jgi:hypothetical protein
MKAARSTSFFVVASGIAVACNSGVADSDLVGVWTNDDNRAIKLTLHETQGSAGATSDSTGTVAGTLTTPDAPTKPFAIDVRRDALDKPFMVITFFSSQGNKDILCQGCDVADGHMHCASALATIISTSGSETPLGRSCNWTR